MTKRKDKKKPVELTTRTGGDKTRAGVSVCVQYNIMLAQMQAVRRVAELLVEVGDFTGAAVALDEFYAMRRKAVLDG